MSGMDEHLLKPEAEKFPRQVSALPAVVFGVPILSLTLAANLALASPAALYSLPD